MSRLSSQSIKKSHFQGGLVTSTSGCLRRNANSYSVEDPQLWIWRLWGSLSFCHLTVLKKGGPTGLGCSLCRFGFCTEVTCAGRGPEVESQEQTERLFYPTYPHFRLDLLELEATLWVGSLTISCLHVVKKLLCILIKGQLGIRVDGQEKKKSLWGNLLSTLHEIRAHKWSETPLKECKIGLPSRDQRYV